jgi:hypothetical protein
VPDFWSLSGSGLILGGAIWVAVAKSRIKHEEDVERDQYRAVELDETNGMHNEDEFEAGDDGDDEMRDRHVRSDPQDEDDHSLMAEVEDSRRDV